MLRDFLTENQLWVLKFLVTTLEQNEIKYQVTGGLAGNVYGSNWRLHDIDLEVLQKKFQRVVILFKDFTVFGPSRFVDEEFDLMLLRLLVQGVEVDINQVEDAFGFTPEGIRFSFDTNLDRARQIEFFGLSLFLQPLEDLIAYNKLLERTAALRDLMSLLLNFC